MTGKLWLGLIVAGILIAALLWFPREEGVSDDLPEAVVTDIAPEISRPPEPTVAEPEALGADSVIPGGLRDPARIDELIERGWIDPKYRDLWVSLPKENPLAEVEMWQMFAVMPEDRGGPCDYAETGGSVCWNHFGYHPYLGYEHDTLRTLAESDAVAAAALAIAIPGGGDNAHERLHYALRAAELSGKPGPIYRYVEKSVVVWSLTDQPMLMERYALHLVADSFDTPFYKSRAMEEYLMGQNNMTQEELRNFGWELYGEMQAAASAAAERNRPGN